jgi:hypothetical protein
MITLKHTKDEVELILRALQELPHKLVHELLMKIHTQAVPQVQAAEVPPDAPPENQPQAK